MKIKSNIVAVIVAVFFLFAGILQTQAQGMYGNGIKKTEASVDNTSSSKTKNAALFRDDSGGFGGGGEDRPDPGEDDPIGEGILILSLLSGGYALIKRNVRKKHEG